MKKEKRYMVQLYSTVCNETHYFSDSEKARAFAFEMFNEADIYKVKVFDTFIGQPEPNNPNCEALKLELV